MNEVSCVHSTGGSSLRSPSVQIAFHDISIPERNRFFVKRSPSGEMATVYASPSMRISRRIVRSSFVAMIVIPAASRPVRTSPPLIQTPRAAKT